MNMKQYSRKHKHERNHQASTLTPKENHESMTHLQIPESLQSLGISNSLCPVKCVRQITGFSCVESSNLANPSHLLWLLQKLSLYLPFSEMIQSKRKILKFHILPLFCVEVFIKKWYPSTLFMNCPYKNVWTGPYRGDAKILAIATPWKGSINPAWTVYLLVPWRE